MIGKNRSMGAVPDIRPAQTGTISGAAARAAPPGVVAG